MSAKVAVAPSMQKSGKREAERFGPPVVRENVRSLTAKVKKSRNDVIRDARPVGGKAADEGMDYLRGHSSGIKTPCATSGSRFLIPRAA